MTEDELRAEARKDAVMPSPDLVDMRNIYAGMAPVTPGEIMMQGIKDRDPLKFAALKNAAERDWRRIVSGLKDAGQPVADDAVVAVEEAEEAQTLTELMPDEWDLFRAFCAERRGRKPGVSLRGEGEGI